MIQVRHGYMLVLHLLVVEVDDLEFFPVLVCPLAQRRQGTPLLSAFAPLLFYFHPPLQLLCLRDDRDHYPVAAGIHSRFARHHASFLNHHTVGRSPSGIEATRLLCRLHGSAFLLHHQSQLFAAELDLGRASQVLRRLVEARGALILTTGHLAHAARNGIALPIDHPVRRRDTAHVAREPPAP